MEDPGWGAGSWGALGGAGSWGAPGPAGFKGRQMSTCLEGYSQGGGGKGYWAYRILYSVLLSTAVNAI